MRKLLLALTALACAGFAAAQPTISAGALNPAIGDSIFLKQCDSTYVQTAGGAGVTWNYGDMGGYTSSDDYGVPYRDATTMPDYSNPGIGNSTVAQDPPTFKGGDAYVLPSASNVLLYGYSINIAGLGSVVMDMDTDPAEIMTYPFTYLTSNSDAFSGTLHSSLGTYPFSGQVTVTGDGYGTLNMPFMAGIPNVLRVHTHDSTFANAGILGTFTFLNHRWEYYEPSFTMPGVDAKYPLLTFATSDLNGAQSAWVTTQLKVIASVTEFTVANELSVYPNPAEDQTTFSYNLTKDAMVNINIVGAQGNIIQKVYNDKANAGQQKVTIDTRNLAAGYYFIKIDIDNQTTLEKLIVK